MNIKWIRKLKIHFRDIVKQRTCEYQSMQCLVDDNTIRQALLSCNAIRWREEGENYLLLSRLNLQDNSRDQLLMAMQTHREGVFSMRFKACLDGAEPHWYEIRMHTKTETGDTIVRFGVLVNIDNIKELEARELEVMRIRTNTQTREGFLSTIRHEVRTPLNAIVGFSQVLSLPQYQLSETELQRYTKEIESNTSVLQKMINDILLATLMHRSNISADMKPQIVNQLISPVNWPEASGMISRRENNLIIHAPNHEITIDVDDKMFSAIMENFIINASKFSSEGSTITINYGLSGQELEVAVKDEGIGIPEELHDRIFDSFFKIDRFKPGCGLGLYISKAYANLMGGTISVESKPGEGSVFRLKLKCKTPKEKEVS